MSKVSVGFSYGILMGSLEKQANEQGYTFGKDEKFVERLRESYNLLAIHVLTNSQSNTILQRLHKEVVKYLKKIEQ